LHLIIEAGEKGRLSSGFYLYSNGKIEL